MSSSSTDCGMAPAYAVAVRNACCHSVAALTFLVWQAFLTFDKEVQYIWPMRNKNPFKWTYFYLRYAVIVAHMTHNYLIEELGNGSNPTMLCDIWRVYIIAFAQSLATSLELILASRMYALYNRSKRVGLLLLILLLTEIGGSARMLWLRDTIGIHGTCLLTLPTSDSNDQTIIWFMVHCTLIGLTLFKYIVASRAGWGRTPLVSLVVRDGSTVYATKFFFLISAFLIFGLDKEQGIIVFFWVTALMSTLGCYLVVNMERFARGDITREAPEPVFSEFSIEL